MNLISIYYANIVYANIALCRSGVRAKPGVDMVGPAEARTTRLSKEGRTFEK